jgi:NAD(P)-dependent dehydrogenase (short-subunit alcohol dehydrogenase family)
LSELDGKTAIITGASKGIGEATVREFISRGINVIAGSRALNNLEDFMSRLSIHVDKVHPIQCDVSDYEDAKKITRFALDRFGKIDILVNNAGLIDPISRLAESIPEEWAKVADVNYKGVYHCIRSVLPEMLSAGQGIIVNVSTGAAISPREGWSHYCSSKAAALMLTKTVHHEYASQCIRSIGLSPGTVKTEMQTSIRTSGLNPISKMAPSDHSLPEKPAKVIAWLCTDDAKEFDGDDVSIKDFEIQKRARLL